MYNNFGFAVGGPVWIPGCRLWKSWRKKLFCFVNEDWIRYRFADTQRSGAHIANAPGRLQRTAWPGIHGIRGDARSMIRDLPRRRALQAASPIRTTSFRKASEPQRSGDPECISHAHARISSGNQNWIAQAAHPINQRKEVINVDFVINHSHHIEFRRQNATYLEYQPFDQGSGLTGKYFNRPNQTNGLAWTWTVYSDHGQ